MIHPHTTAVHVILCRCMQVDDGAVYLHDQTILKNNSAPNGAGMSFFFDNRSSGFLEYTLPAPPGRWLYIRGQSDSFRLESGVEDADFPYACPAGVVGGTNRIDQTGPSCSQPWYAH